MLLLSEDIYRPTHKIRIVTAASLFDGHDASINIMRRIIQSTGVEVIHLGHNRSVEEIVNVAIQEDVQAICLTSYQGGHIEYFKYMFDLLNEKEAGYIKIFGGGGGVILPEEIKELMAYGITKIYSPDDGRKMGLQGMINELVALSDFDVSKKKITKSDPLEKLLQQKDAQTIARFISLAENNPTAFKKKTSALTLEKKTTPVIGITGTGGAGKSSLVDELTRRFLLDNPSKSLGILSVDPSKRKTGGALLGDRIRMNAVNHKHIYMRSLATRQSNLALSKHINDAITILKWAGFDMIILETSGIGQSDTEIIDHSDISLYVMTPEFGAASQLEKIDMLDFATIVAINKFDKRGALDALRDVKKQYVRNKQLWETPEEELPVFGTIASQFNDTGMNALYQHFISTVNTTCNTGFNVSELTESKSEKNYIIPPSRVRYLSEIAENNRAYDKTANEQSEIAQQLYALFYTIKSFTPNTHKDSLLIDSGINEHDVLENIKPENSKLVKDLIHQFQATKIKLTDIHWNFILEWNQLKDSYRKKEFIFNVRGKENRIETHSVSLSNLQIPKIALPKYQAWGDILKWSLQENVPGKFPYTSGLYPFKRTQEDPTRMFAGEGSPERTNRRFHYISKDLPAKRLSTAFDSVTLYGNDPDYRPDIYGKIGNAGVNICCLDDMKKLYSGFDLVASATSVSMTINGPAPIILSYFLNAAIDQQCEKYIKNEQLGKEVAGKIAQLFKGKEHLKPTYNGEIPEGNNQLGLLLLGVTGDQVLPQKVYESIKEETLNQVRGTVQADILKEDQAQNTCIFSTEFALRLMGDVQSYFIKNQVRNFYSVSISGYHIAEAGANPITQLAFTLANGFTYIEYYLTRGMDIDDFAPNLSFFFSNGVDPEYAVIGRVARKIWSKALKFKYGANKRSQMLKYHIQTSGRSLHAQEIDFNDIRTTLQALYAIYDNCNSLHTNAYDEAITTPTEDSVRRAMAIQLIINKELGLNKNENPIQGSFIIEELTDLVEEATLKEFDRITERGGVLGAMETMYQRGKIQEESMRYETLKHTGEYPIIGVNTFLNSKGSPTVLPSEVIRATKEEKENQINTLQQLHQKEDVTTLLEALQEAAISNQNIFDYLMELCKKSSLGQITNSLLKVGGEYRRNM